MRLIYIFLTVFIFTTSCSKKEVVPFVPSIADSLNPEYFHDLAGTYRGDITPVQIVTSSQTGEIGWVVIGPSVNHELDITTLKFSSISLDHISKFEQVGAESFIQRVENDAYLQFDDKSMDSNMAPKFVYGLPYRVNGTVYVDSFNGFWSIEDNSLNYFIEYTQGSSIENYLFEGKKL